MTLKQKTPLAFCSKTPRFSTHWAHPGLDPQGLKKPRPQACDPALYHPQPMDQAYKKLKKVVKDPWRCKAELEDWCKNLGYRNQSILEERQWQASLLGPCWVEVPTDNRYDFGVCPNVGFGRTPRFKKRYNNNPGPGTYFRNVPYKAPYGPHSTRPTFEREEPCRFPDRAPKWSLPPNRYNYDRYDDSIQNKPNKIVSLRGPYDLFTGKRDDSTIWNHFSVRGKISAATWPLLLPGSLEGLKNKHTGELNKTGRDKPPRNRTAMSNIANVPRKASEPGPTDLNMQKPYDFKQNKYGFNISYNYPPGYVKQTVWPGVGRYRVSRNRSCGIPGQGHRHVFLSKVPRTVTALVQQPMNNF